MTQEQRIRLALAQGYEPLRDDWAECEPKGEAAVWYLPGEMPVPLPDPANNPADAEQLVRFLNEQGYTVDLWMSHSGTRLVKIYSTYARPISWQGDDWKTGLVELAMKIVGEGE